MINSYAVAASIPWENSVCQNTDLPMHLIERYTSRSQKARVLTETWVGESLRCPACGCELVAFLPNTPARDFCCIGCNEQFELKAKKGQFGRRVTGAAHKPLIESMQRGTQPSLILLEYAVSHELGFVTSVEIIHKKALTEECVSERLRRSSTARRNGWQGCEIDLDEISCTARIRIIQDRIWRSQEQISASWKIAKNSCEWLTT